jgi:hypothetical protein
MAPAGRTLCTWFHEFFCISQRILRAMSVLTMQMRIVCRKSTRARMQRRQLDTRVCASTLL